MIETLAIVALYLIPLYITNASALIFGGKKPLDFGKKLFGKEILGKGKTFKGTFLGISIGILSVFLLSFLLPEFTALFHPDYLLVGSMICVGALAGDLVGSFIKRRTGVPRGGQILILDQLDFVIGGIAFSYWARTPSILETTLIIVITLIAHRAANFIAFKWKMKSVPW